MKHSVDYMRAQAFECVEKHRGDGLAPMVVELCEEVDRLDAHLKHALGYVSDDDMPLAMYAPDRDEEEELEDDEGTARRVEGENTLGSDQTPPDERRDLGKSANEDA